MKQITSKLYVMTLGMAAGVAFDSAYAISDLHSPADADLAKSAAASQQKAVNRNWTQSAVRLTEVVRQLVRQPLARKARKVVSAA